MARQTSPPDPSVALEANVERNVISKLITAGLSPELIAISLDRPVSSVRSIIVSLKQTPPEPVLDERLAEDVRGLATLALREARLMIEFGSPEMKLAIIKPMLSSLAKHVAQSVGGEGEEARSALEELLTDMREHVPHVEHVVTDTDILDVEATEAANLHEVPDAAPTPSPFPTEDQDEGSGVHEPPL